MKLLGASLIAQLAALFFAGWVTAAIPSAYSEFAGCPEADDGGARKTERLGRNFWAGTRIAGPPTIESAVPGGVSIATDKGSGGSYFGRRVHLAPLNADALLSRISGGKESVTHVAVTAIPGCA